MNSSYIDTSRGSIYTESKGKGVAYLWSHGLTHSIQGEQASGMFNWDSLPKRCRMIQYDALGHGRSTGTTTLEDYCWPRLADDIFRVADYYQLDRFVVGGASMGSASSIYAALKQPARIKGLVLVIPPTAWATRQAQIDMYEKLAVMIETGGFDTYLRQQQMAPVVPAFLKELNPDYKAIRQDQLKQMNSGYMPAIYRGAGSSDLPDGESFADIDCPVLVLGWHGDIGHPASTSEYLFDLLPQAEGSIASSAEEVRQWPQRIGDFVESIG